MDSRTSTTGEISFKDIMKYFLYFLAGATAISIIGYLIYWVNKKYNDSKRNVSNPENNERIRQEQVRMFDKMYMSMERRPAYQVMKDGLKTSKQTIASLKEDEKAFINYSILTADNAGYMGPLENGVFSEEDAIRIAFKAGCRAFVLRVDYLEDAPTVPVLVVRNSGGDKISNNTGSIAKTINAIAQNAPRGSDADPIIIILFFQRLPDKNEYSPTAINFMKNVADSLTAMKDRHLGLTSDGDYRRQKQQDMIFIRSRSQFDGKFIVMTNVDTRGFRDTKLNAGIKPGSDLDLWVHARLYRDTSSLRLTASPDNTKAVTPFAETTNYLMNIPDDRLQSITSKTKVQWTVALNNSTGPVYERETLSRLLDKIGVCSIPVNIFDADTKKLIDTVFAPEFYGQSGWRVKTTELRYVNPKPVALDIPNKQLDARGGYLPIPKV